MRFRSRRVFVKARVVKLYGARSTCAVRGHLRYLERDGASREGARSPPYSTFSDDADGKKFLERSEGDRHQFRFIVSPDDGALFGSLHSFTRELLARMEQDVGTTLDWIAVDHFDTGHPHTHVLMRGETEEGKILQIAGNYIAGGIRARASQVMTEWLGPQSELEVREQYSREVESERLTKLDRDLLANAEGGVVDLRQTVESGGLYQQMLIGRARVLERMGLAEREGSLSWKIAPDLETTLGDVGRRGEIIRAMRDGLRAAGLDRRPELFVVDRGDLNSGCVVGKVVHRGAGGEHHNWRFLVIDGIDGFVHYVEGALGLDDVPIGSVARIDPAKATIRKVDQVVDQVAWSSDHVFIPGHEENSAPLLAFKVQILSRQGPAQEATLRAPTWLDRQLRHEMRFEIAQHGFGRDVRDALHKRLQWLIEQGFAEQRGDQVLLPADIEQRLRRAELGTTVNRLRKELGLDFAEVAPGDPIVGVLQRRIDLKSGQFALIENSREFMLVPWQPGLERSIGRELSGVIRNSGSIGWRIGREWQGPGIDM